jgi:hypothetical protein
VISSYLFLKPASTTQRGFRGRISPNNLGLDQDRVKAQIPAPTTPHRVRDHPGSRKNEKKDRRYLLAIPPFLTEEESPGLCEERFTSVLHFGLPGGLWV